MKIASQLVSSTPTAGAKAAPVVEGSNDFQGVLSVAAAANFVNGKDKRQTIAKDIARDTPMAADSKKKPTSSESTGSDTVAAPSIPQQLVAYGAATPQAVVPVPVKDGATSEDTNQPFGSLQISVNTGDEKQPSASSIAVSPAPAINTASALTSSVGSEDKQAIFEDVKNSFNTDKNKEQATPSSISSSPSLSVPANEARATVAGVEKKSVAATATKPVESLGNEKPQPAPSLVPSHSPLPATVLPAKEQPASAALPTIPTTDAPKKVDASSAEPSDRAISVPVDPANSSVPAPQQKAATAVQQPTVPVSLPGANAAVDFQTPSTITADKLASGTKAVDPPTNTRPIQAPAVPSKVKSAAVPSEVHGKAADTKDGGSSASNAPVAKAAEVPQETDHAAAIQPTVSQGPVDHAPKEIAVGAATLQSAPQPTSQDGLTQPSLTTSSVNTSTGSPAQTTPLQAPAEHAATQGVSSAQLTQSMRSSEMKLGMQSTEFGNISITTSLNHQAISAQISFEHAELGKALAVHLPAIEEKLGSAYGVQAKVELRESNNPSSSNESGYSSTGQQSRDQRQSGRNGSAAEQGAIYGQISQQASFTPASPTVSSSRLDVRI